MNGVAIFYVALKIFRRGTKTQKFSDTIVCEIIWNTCWLETLIICELILNTCLLNVLLYAAIAVNGRCRCSV